MTDEAGRLVPCYFCGSNLSAAPPGRLDECANCGRYVHVCRMCRSYDPTETSKQCREDDAEAVQDKQAANFCDYFRLRADAFDPAAIKADAAARSRLANLFGEPASDRPTQNEPSPPESELLKDAEALFRK